MLSPPDCLDPGFAAQFLEIQRTFVGGLPQRLRSIQQAPDLLARYAALHQLTGAAGGYGFTVLSARARDAMDAVRIDIDTSGALASLAEEITRIYALSFDGGAVP
ncbi:MAG: hypothetical protein RL682_75 [Pseudomonadota bacterium]